jgi:hypothetical protein
VHARTCANRVVRNAILDDTWIRDIVGALNMAVLEQYGLLWQCLYDIQLVDDTPNRFGSGH